MYSSAHINCVHANFLLFPITTGCSIVYANFCKPIICHSAGCHASRVANNAQHAPHDYISCLVYVNKACVPLNHSSMTPRFINIGTAIYPLGHAE